MSSGIGIDAIYDDEPTIHVDSPRVASSAPQAMASRQGQSLMHPVFGKGLIIQTTPSTITCIFEGHGVQAIPATQVKEEAL